MKVKVNEAILKYVKEHSPKSYAKRIENRCQAVINKINELSNTSDDKIRPFYVIEKGCPHCKGNCSKCLWDIATDRFDKVGFLDEPCTSISFNGYNWKDVHDFVTLCPDKVMLYFHNNKEWLEDTEKVDKVMAFLQGHIDWAREKGWGKYYKGRVRK